MRTPSSLLFTPAPTSAYIHLPFCAQKCAYCAFPVVVSSNPSAHASYIDLLTREIKAFFSRRPKPVALHTLYFGGGTPSLLHPSLLSDLLDTLRENVDLHPNAEITAEMDPATFNHSTAKQFAALGVNRASIGAQSFDDRVLSVCRRIHTARDIPKAVEIVRDVGIREISLDLISGLPGQTRASWRDSLEQTLSLDPEHISAYDLTLEPGTPFHARYTEGVSPLPNETEATDMMSDAADTLSRAGFEHYEISNYARSTHGDISTNRSRHNMAYWQNKPFYAFGLGATSLVDGFRFARPRVLGGYRRYVANLEEAMMRKNVNDPHELQAILYPNSCRQTDIERQEDFLINSFRLLREGIEMDRLEDEFGINARQRLESAVQKNAFFLEENLIESSSEDERIQYVRLTEKGAYVENFILSTLLQDALWRFVEG